MPRLWTETVEAHRRAVREAILETTWALVREHGPASVTMSQIAEETGIGRPTLYKYFPDVDAILLAWHERHVTAHLEHLREVRDQASDAGERLEAVLQGYARICYHHQHASELAAFLHRGEHVDRVRQQLHELFREVVAGAAEAGDVRADVNPDELAGYCRHALAAAGELPSEAAVNRLADLTLAALRPPTQ